MAIGMTYEEYWFGAPRMATAYLESYELKKQLKNEELWLQGMYIYNAFAVVMSNSFSKGSKAEYPKEPYGTAERNAEKEKARQIDEIVSNLESFYKSFNRKGK